MKRCECCGVEHHLAVMRRTGGVLCAVCSLPCDGIHHGARYDQVRRLLADGKLGVWDAIACIAFEDSWITGHAVIRPPDGDVFVAVAPKRWEVVIARSRCTGVGVPVQTLVDAAMAPFVGLPNTWTTRTELENEIRVALYSADPTTAGVEVRALPGKTARDEIEVTVAMRSADPPCTVTPDTGVAIPDDILARPRGSA